MRAAAARARIARTEAPLFLSSPFVFGGAVYAIGVFEGAGRALIATPMRSR